MRFNERSEHLTRGRGGDRGVIGVRGGSEGRVRGGSEGRVRGGREGVFDKDERGCDSGG